MRTMRRSVVGIFLACAGSIGCTDPSAAPPDAAVQDAAVGRDGGSDTDAGPPATCGDLICAASESCESCEVDCDPCVEPPTTECNDGVDNDGDGLVDWALDVGCWSTNDATETSGSRAEESGWTTFDPSPDSRFVYVSSSEGDDANDGLTPATAVASPARGAALVRDGFPDFLLFRRGDTWRAMDLGPDRVARRFKSGRDAAHRLVVSSYGDSVERPRFEIDQHFIDDDASERSYLAIVGLAFISFPKVAGDPAFNGADGGALRYVGTGHDILIEDNYVEYGELTLQNVSDVEVRRNVVYRSYHVGTCAYNADGSRNPSGDSMYRPSGIFAGSVDGLIIEGNLFDENGWNPDVAEACATIYNHDLYLSGNDRVVVRENLILRASSIGVKMAANETGASNDILIENNLFAEGEIGISMGGNADTEYRFTGAIVRDNVLTDIGRTRPTTRTLSWYIELLDNDDTRVVGNLLVNQPALGNPFGVRLGGASNRAVVIEENLFYGLQRRSVVVDGSGAWSGIRIEANTFASDSEEECAIDHSGGFSFVTYAANAYRSGAPADTWFCVDGDRRSLAEWTGDSGEAGASVADLAPPEPSRNLDSYAAHLAIGSTLAELAASARLQSRHRFRPELLAVNANNYIRAGFGLPPR